MRISIVTISFNQARFLQQCIESIAAQDYPDLEYIVVDAGSTDKSREIIASYPEVISKAVLEPDQGPADGLNKGFAHASGDIFYYLNADDELLPGALARVAHYMESNSLVDVLLGHGLQIDERGRVVRKLYSSVWSPYRYAIGAANAIQQGTFFKASAFHATQGFNIENRTCWDGELLVDMALAGARIDLFPQTLGAFRIYPESISGSGRLEAAYQEDRHRLAEKILGRPLGWHELSLGFFLKVMRGIRYPNKVIAKFSTVIRGSSRQNFVRESE